MAHAEREREGEYLLKITNRQSLRGTGHNVKPPTTTTIG
jgi:hypothetical protein